MPSLQPYRQQRAVEWFSSLPGQTVLASEAPWIARAALEKPGLAWTCISASPKPDGVEVSRPGRVLWLQPDADGLAGDVRCELQAWPLPAAALGCVVIQHGFDLGLPWQPLLAEATRVLVDGGQLWIFGMNPLSPYRRHWWRQGLTGTEPFNWRRRLRAHGLHVQSVAEGIGPMWVQVPDFELRTGAGGRAAYRLRAEKRMHALTPQRRRHLAPAAAVPT